MAMTRPRAAGKRRDQDTLSAPDGVRDVLARMLVGSRLSVICTAIVAFWILFAVLAPFVLPHSAYEVAPAARLTPPSLSHWLGTDEFGRDLTIRLALGARMSLLIGISTVAISLTVGTAIGAIAGLYRPTSGILMRFIDALLAFPSLVLAIVLVAAMGQSFQQILIAMTAVYTPLFARIVYGEVRAMKDLDYAQAAKALGCSTRRIFVRHLLPSMMTPLVVQASFVLASAIIFESSLSFVGAGIPAPEPSWGSTVSAGKSYLVNAPWIMWPPALALTSLVVGFSLLGDRLRDLLDPRSAGSVT